MRRASLAALAVAAAACAPTAAPPRADRRQTIEGLTLNQSDRSQPAWTLRSSLALLHEEQNTADLESPTMDFYKDGKISSRVTARYGVVATDTHDVHLSSAVVVDSFEDHSVLTTEALVYSSKTRLFHTDLDVIVHRPEGVSYGRGMDATPDLSEVRIYQQHSLLNGNSQ